VSTVTAPEGKAPASSGRAFPSGRLSSYVLKLVVLGLIDVMGIWAVAQALAANWLLAVVFLVVALIAINVVYFIKGGLAWKYLLPGLLFLTAFQVYPAISTFTTSFTNYGTGHILDQERATSAIIAQNTRPVPDSPSVTVRPIVRDGTVSMLITDPTTGEALIGTPDGVEPTSDAQIEGGVAVSVDGYETLNLGGLTGNPDYDQQWQELAVPYRPDEGIYLRSASPTRATVASSDLVLEENGDISNIATGQVFFPNQDVGLFTTDQFSTEDGEADRSNAGEFLTPGWSVNVGFDNYARVLTDPGVRSNFIPILLWSFAFAIITVLMQFGFGLMMAMIFAEKKMRGQKIYRSLLIVPYVLPVFMTALVWKALLNRDFGLINQILGQNIWWLGDEWLARLSVLFVNFWIGYSYMFLVVTGALTSIPGDLREAAFVDGASKMTAFRTVVLPLLMVAVSPLLIASFAFNFNNFTLIELLTGGGPFPGSPIDGGRTDLLINYTYRLAFGTSTQALGFAAAISMFIFLIVAAVSAYSFSLTKKLEEIKG
jgi:arabinogalactan oligomer/maltooligosaccharide transport system permease protein